MFLRKTRRINIRVLGSVFITLALLSCLSVVKASDNLTMQQQKKLPPRGLRPPPKYDVMEDAEFNRRSTRCALRKSRCSPAEALHGGGERRTLFRPSQAPGQGLLPLNEILQVVDNEEQIHGGSCGNTPRKSTTSSKLSMPRIKTTGLRCANRTPTPHPDEHHRPNLNAMRRVICRRNNWQAIHLPEPRTEFEGERDDFYKGVEKVIVDKNTIQFGPLPPNYVPIQRLGDLVKDDRATRGKVRVMIDRVKRYSPEDVPVVDHGIRECFSRLHDKLKQEEKKNNPERIVVMYTKQWAPLTIFHWNPEELRGMGKDDFIGFYSQKNQRTGRVPVNTNGVVTTIGLNGHNPTVLIESRRLCKWVSSINLPSPILGLDQAFTGGSDDFRRTSTTPPLRTPSSTPEEIARLSNTTARTASSTYPEYHPEIARLSNTGVQTPSSVHPGIVRLSDTLTRSFSNLNLDRDPRSPGGVMI